jgi:threonine/homoserine/homoserine lactone efflux protein
MDAVALGLALGLGAGLAPGPLLAVVIAATLERGFAAGARVAAAPLVTDAAVVLLCVLVLSELPDQALAGLSIAGAATLAWFAVDALRTSPETAGPGQFSVRRAAVVNLLNPHPWIFWITVGGPLLVEDTAAEAVGFLIAFYALLVGTKVALAGVVAAGRRTALSRHVQPISAVLLSLAAVALLADGLSRL